MPSWFIFYLKNLKNKTKQNKKLWETRRKKHYSQTSAWRWEWVLYPLTDTKYLKREITLYLTKPAETLSHHYSLSIL